MNNSTDFTLDPRLAADCQVLGKFNFSLILLMNNALLPWLILVPQTSETEMTDLSLEKQMHLLEEINLVSAFIEKHFNISKLNIAAIGNIVSQLHIHIVGRSPDDFCWPNVVWGTTQQQRYTTDEINTIKTALISQLGDQFISL